HSRSAPSCDHAFWAPVAIAENRLHANKKRRCAGDRFWQTLANLVRSKEPMRARLDATDWRILKELQANGRVSNVELARKVGISPPPCLRRVRALEEAGMIAGYFALLGEKSVGFPCL